MKAVKSDIEKRAEYVKGLSTSLSELGRAIIEAFKASERAVVHPAKVEWTMDTHTETDNSRKTKKERRARERDAKSANLALLRASVRVCVCVCVPGSISCVHLKRT